MNALNESIRYMPSQVSSVDEMMVWQFSSKVMGQEQLLGGFRNREEIVVEKE